MAIYINGKKVAGNGLGGSGGAIGIPAGGVAGQMLSKKTDEDYDTQWVDPPEGGGGGGTSGVASFNGRTGIVTPQTGDYTADMVGARPNTWTPTAEEVGAIPAAAVTAIQSLTQAEYDALTVKSATTLYLIEG